MPLKGDPALGDYAKQLLKGKPKKASVNASSKTEEAGVEKGFKLHIPIKPVSYHPKVLEGISAHIKERLKKLGA